MIRCGVIGLGRMGCGIAQRALQAGHKIYGFDPDATAAAQAKNIGITIVSSLQELASAVSVVWIMVPSTVVDGVLQELTPHMKQHAIIIDGGNSYFVDSMRRAQAFAHQKISMLDCGTSGGLRGKEDGYCLMVGGEQQAYDNVYPLLQDLAAKNGVARVGPSGAGHYVKMVHNGIEYGLMQAYAEGFQLLKEGSFKQAHLDVHNIATLWNHGAIVRSYLLTLAATIFEHDQELTTVSGVVQESGMGRWAVDDAHKHDVPLPIIEQSLQVRTASHAHGGNYATKVVAMLRNAFGGHKVGKV